MATMLHGESRKLYSWWWDSHSIPKNSKWLQEHITDMDMKIQAMINLIEEDADSFARRAEMYYKKRPELMKLMEEFYRAYRALAERYDLTNGALRQANQTIAQAFPNQVALILPDELPSGSFGTEVEPHIPEMPQTTRASLDPDDLQKDALGVSPHFHVIKRIVAYSKENDAFSSSKGLKQLNEMFASGEGAGYMNLSEGRGRKGPNLHDKEGKGYEHKSHSGSSDLRKREVKEKAYSSDETKNLHEEILWLSMEIQNLGKQKALESECANKAQNEIQSLKDSLSKLNSEKDATLLQYQSSVERISSLESEISNTQNELKKLSDEMASEVMKLRSTEELNQSLRLELDMLEQKAKVQQQELSQKLEELETLTISLEDAQRQRVKAEMALQSLEKMHFQSQEEVKLLSLEIQKGIEKMKEMEQSNVGLEEEVRKLREESGILNRQNLSSAAKINDLQNEIIFLNEAKRTLDHELDLHVEEKKVLQQELCHLKEDRSDLERRNQILMEQMKAAGVNAKSIQELVKQLENGNMELKKTFKKHEGEKEFILEKLRNMEQFLEKNVFLENSLADANLELEVLRQKFIALETLKEAPCSEISSLIAEKALIVSQIEKHNKDVEEISKQDTLLEQSLCDVGDELKCLRTKFKDLEESYQCLNDQNNQEMNQTTGVLQEENTHLKACVVELKKKLVDLEIENSGLKADLNAYSSLLASLLDCATFLEEHTLSLSNFHAPKNHKQQATISLSMDLTLASHQHVERSELSEAHDSMVPPGVIDLLKLITKVEALKQVIVDGGSPVEQEKFAPRPNQEAARKENEELKATAVQGEVKDDTIKQLNKNEDIDDADSCKVKCGQRMKDIQLDEAASSSQYGNGAGSYGLRRIKDAEIDDQMLRLWETAERDRNNGTWKASSVALVHNMPAVEKEKSEPAAEKELGIDKLGIPKRVLESQQEWSRRVLKRLASDAQRLSVLQTSVKELKGKMESSQKGKQPMSLKNDKIRAQLKEVEGALLELIYITRKLTKEARNYSAPSADVLAVEPEELWSMGRMQISEEAWRASEKTGRLELELQKIQYILLKLEEEHEDSLVEAAGRRGKILSRNFYYGRRGDRRQKKNRSCWQCMRPKTEGDD